MKVFKKFIFIFAGTLLFFATLHSSAQGDRLININEFLVFNETNYVDDYGNHTSWIELFNPAYNTVNISKMYVTNDPKNPTKYRIPDAGSLTILEPRSFLMLYADDKPNRGIFHLNFILEESGYFAIYDSDGKTLMDEVYYPEQTVDKTYGRKVDGGDEWIFMEKSTPYSSNVTEITETAAEMFGRLDPSGFALTFISMFVVFSALIILFFVYRFVGNINQNKYTIKVKRPTFLKGKKVVVSEKVELSGEINAAIAMALSMYVSQTHDFENTTITIKKASRPYSPWSSKIYGLRNNPKNR
jgi:Na+-transporting methylmalonyl-CoA/oxaloacetate decarboxylase gamma subunit